MYNLRIQFCWLALLGFCYQEERLAYLEELFSLSTVIKKKKVFLCRLCTVLHILCLCIDGWMDASAGLKCQEDLVKNWEVLMGKNFLSLYFFVYFSYEWVDVLQVETSFTKVHWAPNSRKLQVIVCMPNPALEVSTTPINVSVQGSPILLSTGRVDLRKLYM